MYNHAFMHLDSVLQNTLEAGGFKFQAFRTQQEIAASAFRFLEKETRN